MAARLTLEQRLLRTHTEASWQADVCAMATAHGWRWYHAPDNRPVTAKSGRRYVQNVRRGFPDLVLVKDARVVFAELKRETGKVDPDQVTWLAALRQAGQEVAVWRPSDLERVKAVLSGAELALGDEVARLAAAP